jgi:signal recognition particle receptor subunit beta
MRENIASLQELAENIKKQNKNFREFPMVLQYNKRDVPGALPLETMDQYLNPPQLKMGWQRYEAEAMNGRGVFDTLKAISKLVISRL